MLQRYFLNNQKGKDYAYEKVRLKGYYDSKNKKAKKINDIKYLEEYIRDFCSYGCKVFLLKKIK